MPDIASPPAVLPPTAKPTVRGRKGLPRRPWARGKAPRRALSPSAACWPGGGGHQHGAPRGAGLAQYLPVSSGALAACRHLCAPHRGVAIGKVGRRPFQSNLVPVCPRNT